jgi:DNA-binding LacI/PurR family transcriptional regulator
LRQGYEDGDGDHEGEGDDDQLFRPVVKEVSQGPFDHGLSLLVVTVNNHPEKKQPARGGLLKNHGDLI